VLQQARACKLDCTSNKRTAALYIVLYNKYRIRSRMSYCCNDRYRASAVGAEAQNLNTRFGHERTEIVPKEVVCAGAALIP
jgi:hypothetical protein